MKNNINRCSAIFILILILGVGQLYADTWLYGSFQNWVVKDNDYKFSYDGNIGTYYLELDAATEYEFKIIDGDNYYSMNNANFTTTTTDYLIYTGNGNCKITTGEAGVYVFKTWWADSNRHFSIYFPQARLKKQTYIYFDARRETNWQESNPDIRYWYKYYDSGYDVGSVDCNKSNALEDWVYYALVPDNDYVGRIQLNRLNPSDHSKIWCSSDVTWAKDRTSSAQNCLKEESGKEDYCNSWTPQWTTYCPPMSSVTMADNGTTNWGGDGSSATPYLVPTGGDIKVHVTASASALDDANMTPYFLFKKEGSAVGSGAASTEKTITASSTTGTKEAVIVEAYNYYNSTEGTHLSSTAIYYEARTPYTISYNKGTPAASISGSRESEIKLKDVTFTLPGAVFTRTGYTQTGWATSNGGAKAYELSASYTDNAALALYPVWTPEPYTIRLEGMEADGGNVPIDVDVTYDGVLSQVTPHTKTNYTFDGYWVRNESTHALETQLIDANGNWIADITGYTGNDGAGNPTWIHDYAISLYAKWTEIKHTVTVAVSPAGAGTVQVSGENITEVANVGYVTHSPVMTAVPTNAAWVFKEWRVSDETKLHLDLTNYSLYGENMEITATDDGQTLTAVFEPRYVLVGSIWDDNTGKPSGGMPGWMSQGYGADFTFNSFTALGTGEGTGVDLSCSRDLLENTTYKFQIYDRKDGNYGYRPLGDGTAIFLGDGDSFLFDDQNMDVWVAAVGAGKYTFRITNITLSDGHYYPTVTIERPHQLHMGHVHAEIDNTSATTSGDTGGTLSATIGESPISNDGWYNYGADIAYTASPATGYTAKWYTNSDYSTEFSPQPANSWTDYNVTHDENVYVRFTEKATTVTLSNDGHGKVQINSTDKTSTTCGVTTTRELTAVPNAGYKFSSWSKSGDDITLSSTSTNPTTLTGLGSGLDEGQTVTANFVERYSIKGTMNGENWGTTHTLSNIGTNASSKDTCYVTMTLPANTTYEFAIYDEQTKGWLKNSTTEVFKMTYTNHTNWGFGTDKTVNCGITTAGKGTYKFIFNITDKTVTVVYPTSYQVNYGASVGGSVTSVKDDDNNDVPNGGYVRSGGNVTYTATPNDGYTFVGWCNDDSYGEPFTTYNPWPNNSVTATSNAYAKFKSTNFVIYRFGDMAEDDRAALDDVESYAGGTISEAIEFRMKVHTLDQWYSLCLPFTVNAVKVWDDEDNEYYDIEPYYRTAVGEPLQGGYYIIRTPSSTTDFPIANFNDWRDPTSPTGYVPTKNTPYIIQWHMSYFSGKYISFFGATGQEIDEFTAGTAPSADNVVNIYGNNAMVSGSVAGAYMLEPDYGSDGAWLRLEDASASRTVLPFECYILASGPTRTRYRVIRPGMPTDDTPTGWDDVVNTEPRTDIMVYTITGFPVARYSDCSFAEAARRLRTGHGEGIYILRSGNESVKLMVGGK